MRRGDDGAAHAGTRAGDDEHQDRRRESGEQPEHGPHRGPGDGDPRSGQAVGVVRERDLEEQPADQRERDERQVSLVGEPERVPDLRAEDAEHGSVELVDRVQPEQDEQRVERVARGDLVEVHRGRRGLCTVAEPTLNHLTRPSGVGFEKMFTNPSPRLPRSRVGRSLRPRPRPSTGSARRCRRAGRRAGSAR